MIPLRWKLGGRAHVQDNLFFLSLGSNIGDREKYLQEALYLLNQDKGIALPQCSSIYETDPVGYVDQDSFLNIVVRGHTSYSARTLLKITQDIERTLGREREIHWGPRTIDIDILLYNNKQICEEELVIPHPRMRDRSFVMIPLAEIAGEWIIPGESQNVEQLITTLQGEGVRKWKSPFPLGENVSEPLES